MCHYTKLQKKAWNRNKMIDKRRQYMSDEMSNTHRIDTTRINEITSVSALVMIMDGETTTRNMMNTSDDQTTAVNRKGNWTRRYYC